ncbi:hypothetical protein BCR42DRAFT_319028 [Absidia repens]|uniref:Uncharacterized protein n=1 Tax=Absidia repens TaxID=90262 RepID=A0A1X2IWH6_9FUNG|nr:hypothetical protein BCR42DRAFT_319028 [Absidia repens]
MGCCNSKEDHDEDDVHAPLLSNEVHTDSRMNYQTHETIDVKQEQEFWKDVIDRTTQ